MLLLSLVPLNLDPASNWFSWLQRPQKERQCYCAQRFHGVRELCDTYNGKVFPLPGAPLWGDGGQMFTCGGSKLPVVAICRSAISFSSSSLALCKGGAIKINPFSEPKVIIFRVLKRGVEAYPRYTTLEALLIARLIMNRRLRQEG